MKIVISEPGYKKIDPLEIDLGCRDVTLIGVYNGIGIETDQGCFGICQRDGGIEIMLEGKLVWSSMDHLKLEHQVDAGAVPIADSGRDRNPSTLIIRKRKNPSRSTWQGRLTGWNRAKFEQNNAELEKDFRDSINRLGFDSAFGMPDYVLSEALVSLTWSIARFYRQIPEHVFDAGEQLEDLEDLVDAGAGDPHELEDQVDTGLTARREDVEREPDFIQHGGKIYVDAGYRDRLELEHQVDAGAGNPNDLEDLVDAGAGDPHDLEDQVDAGADSKEEDQC